MAVRPRAVDTSISRGASESGASAFPRRSSRLFVAQIPKQRSTLSRRTGRACVHLRTHVRRMP
eukprot:1349840-Pyramimonas_sp.AAC.1